MTYQEQQEKEPFPNKPKSPIPPLAIAKPCRYCEAQLIIRRERIKDDWNGNTRHRHIPRDLKGNIHDCRKSTNNT